MENQTPFELNQAIRQWRENLAQSTAFQNENLNELESHVRDSVITLQARDLSAEEAFRIATRRIGESQQLESEFSKLNRGNIWLGRAMWMLIGLQVWPFFDRLMFGIAGNLFALGSRIAPHYPSGIAWPVFFSAIVQLPALVIAVWLTWKVLKNSGKFGQWVVARLRERSSIALFGIAACVLAFLASALLILLLVGEWKLSTSGAVTVAFINRARNFIVFVREIGFAVLTLALTRKLLGLHTIKAEKTSFDLNQTIQTWRESLARLPAFRPENLNKLESHLRDSIAALQARGLSAEEGFLIAARRIGQDQQLQPESDKVNCNTIWLERAVWMLLGIQFWPIFDRLLSGIAGNLFALGWRNMHHSPTAVGDAWPVFYSALTQLLALVLAVWLSWKVIWNSQKFGRWVATKLPKRSSFVFCCIAASVLVILLHGLETLLQLAPYRISTLNVLSYIDFSRTFVAVPRVIGFVVITLLLARKQFVPEKV